MLLLVVSCYLSVMAKEMRRVSERLTLGLSNTASTGDWCRVESWAGLFDDRHWARHVD